MTPTRSFVSLGLVLAVLGMAQWYPIRPVSNLHLPLVELDRADGLRGQVEPPGRAQAGENISGASQDAATSGTTNSVTRSEQPSVGDYWTPEKMRQAKPFPMPSIDGPPIPQQTTPSPYTGPPGSSSPGLPGLGGPVHH